MTEGAPRQVGDVGEAVDLGRQAREALIQAGEMYLGDFFDPVVEYDFNNGLILPPPIMSSLLVTAQQQLYRLRQSGEYTNVRTIPAFDRDGNRLPETVGIVASPGPHEPLRQ